MADAAALGIPRFGSVSARRPGRNLEEAVAFHGGEASKTAKRFFSLSPEERLKVQAFVRSLPAPPPGATPR